MAIFWGITRLAQGRSVNEALGFSGTTFGVHRGWWSPPCCYCTAVFTNRTRDLFLFFSAIIPAFGRGTLMTLEGLLCVKQQNSVTVPDTRLDTIQQRSFAFYPFFFNPPNERKCFGPPPWNRWIRHCKLHLYLLRMPLQRSWSQQLSEHVTFSEVSQALTNTAMLSQITLLLQPFP